MEVHAGPGLTSFRKGNSVTLSVVERPHRALAMANIKITGSASGGGKYTGVIWNPPATAAAATGNLTEAEVGTSGEVIRVVNTREVGQTTHDLSSSGYLPLLAVGYFTGVAADGVKVYSVDVRQHEDCT